MEFEPVIGIEVHAQLKTNTKLFCASSTIFGASPNTHVSPVCLGLPGALPVLNRVAVDYAIKAGIAFDCEIRERSVFARKNYFYPDLPKGYQISQFDLPICEHGRLTIVVNGKPMVIGITRIHLEEVAGKLNLQGADAIAGSTGSIVDLNRAGNPLIEIVSEPDIRSAEEARAYVEAIKLTLEHLGICDGNMEQGNLRADVNLSLRPKGTTPFGTRSEVKNLNSFRSLQRAIHVETVRQEEVLRSGGTVIQETRHYDDVKQLTSSLRSKEEAHDYRYFPEPDLPPLVLTSEYIESVRSSMAELPVQKLARYQSDYGFSEIDAKTLLNDVSLDRYFCECVSLGGDGYAPSYCKWIIGDFIAFLKEFSKTVSETSFKPQSMVELVVLIEKGTLSGKMAKEVLSNCIKTDESPSRYVEKAGLSQISDTSELEGVVKTILDQNPDVVTKVKAGKTKSADFLMGQVMRETKGRAKPDLVRSLILTLIETL